MKNRVMQNRLHAVKRTLLQVFIVTFFLLNLLPQQLKAQGNTGFTPISTIIKYLGYVEDKLLFHVKIDNSKGERCFITIQDEEGDILYQQEFKNEKFIKTFSINKEELQGETLIFLLNRGKAK